MAETETSTTSTTAPASSAPASTSTTTPASSGPASTESIARDVIADLEGDGSNDDNTPPAAPAAVAAKPVVAADPDDFDAVPAETVDSLGRKRVNSIPHTRVSAMITKREQALLTGIAKELGLTPAQGAALKLEDIVGSVKDRTGKLTAHEARLKQVDAVEQLIARDPDKFMEIISGINPAYKAYAKAQAAAAAGQQPAKPAVEEDPEPQPDYDLGNGQMTYSLVGIKKRDAWKERQLEKKFDKMLADRFAPVDERFKADKTRAEQEKWHADTTARIKAEHEKMSKWPLFTEHEKEMVQAMRTAREAGNPITPADAYFQVVGPKLAGDRTRVRAEVLAEIEAQPKTSSVATSPAAAKPAADGKPKSTADIAREVIASLDK